jgi:hypothetical protein
VKIRTTKLEAELLDGQIICFRPLDIDLEFDINDARDMARIYDTMAVGGVFASLLDIAGTNVTATPEMRAYGAGKNYKARQVARAITSDTFIHRLIVNHFVKSLNPSVPTRLFADKETAMEWLNEKLTAHHKAIK